MLKIRVRKTLDGVQDGAILKTSPAYATLKTCFSASQWKTKKAREVNDALLDQFIRNMIRDEVSVSYRRPITKTLKQHQDALQKIASQERMSV